MPIQTNRHTKIPAFHGDILSPKGYGWTPPSSAATRHREGAQRPRRSRQPTIPPLVIPTKAGISRSYDRSVNRWGKFHPRSCASEELRRAALEHFTIDLSPISIVKRSSIRPPRQTRPARKPALGRRAQLDRYRRLVRRCSRNGSRRRRIVPMTMLRRPDLALRHRPLRLRRDTPRLDRHSGTQHASGARRIVPMTMLRRPDLTRRNRPRRLRRDTPGLDRHSGTQHASGTRRIVPMTMLRRPDLTRGHGSRWLGRGSAGLGRHSGTEEASGARSIVPVAVLFRPNLARGHGSRWLGRGSAGLGGLSRHSGAEEASSARSDSPWANTGMSADEACEILGVAPGASSDEVETAYRKVMKGAHPDQGGSDWMAAKVNQAKDVLLGS